MYGPCTWACAGVCPRKTHTLSAAHPSSLCRRTAGGTHPCWPLCKPEGMRAMTPGPHWSHRTLWDSHRCSPELEGHLDTGCRHTTPTQSRRSQLVSAAETAAPACLQTSGCRGSSLRVAMPNARVAFPGYHQCVCVQGQGRTLQDPHQCCRISEGTAWPHVAHLHHSEQDQTTVERKKKHLHGAGRHL